ncbi:MAG: hypothetical protein A2079_01360 [Geobacteraceae bacterium GWC2_48_7]|nr:MAG: hypothetical protein A2079_01360 [Geobacteraceae bacterium GWC2_48_7]
MKRILICIITLLVGGCTTYMEKPTPTTGIPEVKAIVQPVIQELPRNRPEEMLQPSPGVYGNQLALDPTMTRESVSGVTGVGPATARFAASYKSAGSPKIVILLNRQLSDEIREWRTDRRLLVNGEGRVSRSREVGFARESETINGPLSISSQTQIEPNVQRLGPGESYVWSFENGFMQPFLGAGTILIDRATIMRLTSRSLTQGTKYDPIEAKKVEMDALVNHADIFIEILISRYPSASYGYEFKASAKEIKTGRILANATSLNWDTTRTRPKRVIATNKGYEIMDDKAFPSAQKVSADLALDLMSLLAAQWERR